MEGLSRQETAGAIPQRPFIDLLRGQLNRLEPGELRLLGAATIPMIQTYDREQKPAGENFDRKSYVFGDWIQGTNLDPEQEGAFRDGIAKAMMLGTTRHVDVDPRVRASAYEPALQLTVGAMYTGEALQRGVPAEEDAILAHLQDSLGQLDTERAESFRAGVVGAVNRAMMHEAGGEQ